MLYLNGFELWRRFSLDTKYLLMIENPTLPQLLCYTTSRNSGFQNYHWRFSPAVTINLFKNET